MKQRIAFIRKEKGYSQEAFASKLNLSRNFINQLESGKKNPSDRTIADICRLFNVNEEWLRTGEGEIYSENDTEADLAHFTAKLFTENSDSFKNRLISVLARLSESDWEVLERVANELTKKE